MEKVSVKGNSSRKSGWTYLRIRVLLVEPGKSGHERLDSSSRDRGVRDDYPTTPSKKMGVDVFNGTESGNVHTFKSMLKFKFLLRLTVISLEWRICLPLYLRFLYFIEGVPVYHSIYTLISILSPETERRDTKNLKSRNFARSLSYERLWFGNGFLLPRGEGALWPPYLLVFRTERERYGILCSVHLF